MTAARTRLQAAALLLAVSSGAAPRVAGAAPPKAPVSTPRARAAAAHLADVDSAEKYYASLDYEDANAIAERVLEGRGLTHDQLVRATRVLALTYATLGKSDQARDAFTTLLALDPDYDLDPNLSPKVTGPFLEARGYWRGQAVKPGVEVVATVPSSDSARLVITTRDPAHIVTSVNLGYRWGQSATFVTRPVAIGDAVRVAIPAPANAGETRLDYYVQGVDERESAVFEVGNAASPKSAVVDAPSGAAAAPLVLPEKPTGKSLLASPYFWTAAGAVVAGALVGGFFLFRPRAPSGATLTGGAECGDEPCR